MDGGSVDEGSVDDWVSGPTRRAAQGPAVTDVATLAERVRALAPGRRRVLIGIAGAPGAGKSTLARMLADALQPHAVVVGMDGFHLPQHELVRLGRAERKGAPDTFDVDGYVTLLRRLRDVDHTVYAPEFRREIEASVADAITVEPTTSVVLTEGNYLLLDRDGWQQVAPLLDEVWFVDIDPDERRRRLTARRRESGVSEAEARRWTYGSDEQNARTVEGTRARADLIVRPG